MAATRRFAGVCLTLLLATTPAAAQQVVNGLLLPNGLVVTDEVYRRDGTSIPSLTTGADANLYLKSVPPTQSFVNGAPAFAVLTSEPTQYVRVFTQGITNAAGGFIAPANAIRGLAAAQVRDVLALPFLPDSITIVRVPAGTCIIFGTGAPITGNFPANPPAIPTAGPWGNGGASQGLLVGITSDPHCANPGFVPLANFTNRQALGAAALAYGPRAGGGNTGAVAVALDHGAFPAQFSDMGRLYDSLDLVNIGAPDQLRAALKQLDGEAYADFALVQMTGARKLIALLHRQLRSDRNHPTAAPQVASLPEPATIASDGGAPAGTVRTDQGGLWFAPFGALGSLSGDASTHDVSYSLYGLAAGAERRLSPEWLVGASLAYAHSAVTTAFPGATGSNDAVSVVAYAGYAPGEWYADGTLGYAYNTSSLSRSIAIPGFLRTAQGHPIAHQILGSLEVGRTVATVGRAALTPFARAEIVTTFQSSFSESGAGAIGLTANAQTTTGVRSILGLELAGIIALSEQQPLRLALRLGWAHDYADLSGTMTANFLGKPDTTFTVFGPTPDRDGVLVGLGLELPLRTGRAFLAYDGELAQRASVHAGTIGLRIAF
ncbi:MAG TPA: autotransporter outer membrane beta-barrel domain-containing protein [Reyranella sp.]|nr:autotransporter outer membrane beta-barrel domain-containing protein [Reyranella sp.]